MNEMKVVFKSDKAKQKKKSCVGLTWIEEIIRNEVESFNIRVSKLVQNNFFELLVWNEFLDRQFVFNSGELTW